jgi:N-acetylated-alpha-linked acidic dipeptidase
MGTDTELVLPVSSRGSTRPRRAAVRLLSAGALFLLLAYLLTPRAPSVPEDAHVSAYWDAVSSRNFERVLADKYDARITALPHCKHDNKITPARAEQIYLSVPSNDSAAAASLRYTSHAHSAGTGWDFVTALQVKNDWERALGVPVTAYDEAVYDAGEARAQARIKHGMGRLSVWVDTYYPVMNSPVYGAVTLLSDPPVKAKLREAHLKGDPDSELADEVRAFHGFSVSGDVTAKYVYVGYGRKADFDLLARNGVDLNGTIAVVKYGRVFRGLKVKAAQEAGAVGCIIYTDPGDDGDVTEANGYKQYPDGPARVVSTAGLTVDRAHTPALERPARKRPVPLQVPRRPDYSRRASVPQREPRGGHQHPVDPLAPAVV